jgi:hypothetical protein
VDGQCLAQNSLNDPTVQRKNDRGGNKQQSSHHGLSRGRCRVHGKSLLHYIENTGDTDLIFLEMFKSSFYQDISFAEWLSHTPPELVMAHLNIERTVLDVIPKDKLVVMSG